MDAEEEIAKDIVFTLLGNESLVAELADVHDASAVGAAVGAIYTSAASRSPERAWTTRASRRDTRTSRTRSSPTSTPTTTRPCSTR